MKDIALTEAQDKALIELGLNKTQVRLYLTSLKNGTLSVLELSKLTKINRQQIYAESEKLVDLGLYDITRRQGRKYIPANPSKLLVLQENKINSLQKNFDLLSNLSKQLESAGVSAKSQVKTKYYEGLAKIKEAYEEELKQAKNTEVLSFVGSLENIYIYFPEHHWDKWNRKFVKQGSNSKMLVHYSDVAKKSVDRDSEYHRETRYLHNFPLKVNVDIFNNSILIASFQDKFALWIDSQIITHSYRIIFNSLWQQAKKF